MSTNKKNNRNTQAVEAQKYIAYMIARGEEPEIIQSLWENYITDLVTHGGKIDVEELVQSVLSQSYLQTNNDLQTYAKKVKFYTEIRDQIRSEIKRLRDLENDIDCQIKRFEEKLDSVGDDAQLANVDLQNMLQKQQQTLQMMSNISKLLHDTAMAIIRKIGG